MSQEVKEVPIDDLRLWTENPRDPVDASLSDAEVISRALSNESENWNLDKLILEMGHEYHFNELPTVVMTDGIPVVYDGNRRIAVMKCLRDPSIYQEACQKLPLFESCHLQPLEAIPCDVCDLDTALDIVERIHAGSKKWGRLQYEQFKHIHRGAPKGRLMIFDEASDGLVSSVKQMNEEYVQKRLLSDANLAKIGFSITDEVLSTSLDEGDARKALEDIAEVMKRGLSSARHNPGDLKAALIELDEDRYKDVKPFSAEEAMPLNAPKSVRKGCGNKAGIARKIRRTKEELKVFGGMTLRPNGKKSDMVYRAIDWIDEQYRKRPDKRDFLLPILGCSLRIFIEIVAREYYSNDAGKEVAKDDQVLNDFMKDVVKPLVRSKQEKETQNYLALEAEWINGKSTFEATLHKWAHGTMDASYESIVRQSKIIAEIVREEHWKN